MSGEISDLFESALLSQGSTHNSHMTDLPCTMICRGKADFCAVNSRNHRGLTMIYR